MRATKCERNGNITSDASGNMVCGACKKLHTDDSFKGAVSRSANPSVRARRSSERGPEEKLERRRQHDQAYQRAKRSNSIKLQLKGSVRHALNCVIGGKLNFKKVSEALRKLSPGDIEGSKEAAAMPGACDTEGAETDVRHAQSSSRDLKVSFVCDILQNVGRDARGQRHSPKVMQFMKIVRLVGGPQVSKILSTNLGLPAESTLAKENYAPPWRAGFHKTNWESIRASYLAVAEANPGIKKCLVLSAEDETGVRPEVGWDATTDTITGLCGLDCENHCPTLEGCRKRKNCNPVHQCLSNELVLVVGNDPGAYDRVKAICETYRKGRMLRIMMLNPLDPKWPRLVCAHFDTCNAFSAKDYVNYQWRQVELYYQKYVADIVGPLVGFASDGDGRRRKLMLHYALDADPDKLMCFCCAPNALQRGCTRERYGLPNASFTLKAWKIIRGPRQGVPIDTLEAEKFWIRYIGDQDYIHCGKKLINCTCHASRHLRLGPYMHVHINQITSNMKAQTREEHGLLRGDDVRGGWKAMDWPSAVRLMKKKHLVSLHNLRRGRGNLVPNESVGGMLEYLKICRMYVSIFADWSLTNTERTRRAGIVVTYLRLWYCYVKHDPHKLGLKLQINFITREAFQDTLLSCHAAVLIIMANRDLTPWQVCNLVRAGTDCCEDFFSFAGSSVANKRVYSTLEARRTIRNHLMVILSAAMGNVNMPKNRKNRKQVWDHEGDKRTVLDNPENEVLSAAWKRGSLVAYVLATQHGMIPQDASNVRWWTHPWEYADEKFACARGDGIDDDWYDENEDDSEDEDLEAPDQSDRDSDDDDDDGDDDDGDDDDGHGEVFGACIDAVAALGEPATDPKIRQTIYVPYRKEWIHKATVVTDLANGGRGERLSADRVIRAQAAKAPTQKGDAKEEANLGVDDWFVGIETDVAVKVQSSDNEIGFTIEVGRVIRILRTGGGKGKKQTDYRLPVKLSTLKDRQDQHTSGVRFYCHFYKRKNPNNKTVRAGFILKENPFTCVICPEMIVSPVVIKYDKDNKNWQLNKQSRLIWEKAAKGDTVVALKQKP